MTILAMDVTSPYGSLALRRDGVTLAQRTLDSVDGFAHLIYQAIEELLAEAGVSLEQVDCFASANGPGAFTGVRVGLTTVKGLAEAMGKPVCGISNLRAVSAFGNTDRRGVLLDARRGDVFAAIYNSRGDLEEEESITKTNAWLNGFAGRASELVLQDAALIQHVSVPVVVAPRYLAAAVAALAGEDGKRAAWMDPAALDANYVRRSDAELFWKEI